MSVYIAKVHEWDSMENHNQESEYILATAVAPSTAAATEMFHTYLMARSVKLHTYRAWTGVWFPRLTVELSPAHLTRPEANAP